MFRSILIFVLGFLIIMRLNSVWHTIIKGGLKFMHINSTIKWIYYLCALYLFYTISYVIVSDIPITILLKYTFINFICIEIFNVIRLWIYTPITFYGSQYIFNKLEKANFKFAEFFATALVTIDTLFICILEILFISSVIAFNYVTTTDTLFNEQTITAFILLTFGLLLYAMLTGSGGIWLMIANHHDIVWSRGRFNVSAGVIGLTFFLFFISGSVLINRIFYKNDILGILDKTSDTEIMEVVETFDGFEKKLISDLSKSDIDLIAQNQKIIKEFNYNSYSEFDAYKKYSVDLYKKNPLHGLYALSNLVKELSEEGKYHKMEVEMLRAHYYLKSEYNKYNYRGKVSRDELEELKLVFDNLQQALMESVSRQNVKSDVALLLFRDLISIDEQKVLTERPSWAEYNYQRYYRRRYEIGIRYLAEFVWYYPEEAAEVENDVLQIIERNKARNFNQNIDAQWLSSTQTLQSRLNDNQCGLNYIVSNFSRIGIGQYYDSDTTINFVIPLLYNDWKNISEKINNLADDDDSKRNISSYLAPDEVYNRMENKDLLLSTDGFLQEIPFQYIFNDVHINSITSIPSFSSLTDLPIKSQRKLLAVSSSSPNYDLDNVNLLKSERASSFDSLRYSLEEVQRIAKYAQQYLDTAVIKNNVSEGWFKDNISMYDIIHFAGHSDQYGIYLDSDDSNDGVFSITEIETVDLEGQLVFLSSCEGAVGDYEIGEGITSIAKAFLRAGASGVIASLWKLNDEKTAALVKLFYENYFQKFDPSVTLYNAQDQYESAFSKFKYPFIYVTYNN